MENEQKSTDFSNGPAQRPTAPPSQTNTPNQLNQPQVFSPETKMKPSSSDMIAGPVQTNVSDAKTKSRRKMLLMIVVIVLLLAGSGLAAMKIKNRSTSSNSAAITSPRIEWVKYNDPNLGFTFSYPKGWHLYDHATTGPPAGRTIYIAPYATNADSLELKNKYLSQPQLAFYIFNTNPAGSLDNQPISSPDKKVGTLTFGKNQTGALVESQYTRYDDSISFSSCANAVCTFKVNGKFMDTDIKTLGAIGGLDGHPVDKSSSIYQTELKIWQTLSLNQ